MIKILLNCSNLGFLHKNKGNLAFVLLRRRKIEFLPYDMNVCSKQLI